MGREINIVLLTLLVLFFNLARAQSAQNEIDSIQVSEQVKRTFYKNKDSINLSLKPKEGSKQDLKINSTKMKSGFKKAIPFGSISLGYDYGFLPYTVNMPSPSFAFVTEGEIATSLLNIPIDVSYFYTTQKNLIGLSNYFRISYNADRYKDKLSGQLIKNLEVYNNQLGDLSKQRQQLMQKMAYTDYLSSVSPNKWPNQDLMATPDSINTVKPNKDTIDQISVSNYSNPSSIPNVDQSLIKDSIYYIRSRDSITQKDICNKVKTDSVRELYDLYRLRYDSVNVAMKEVQGKVDNIETIRNSDYSAYFGKIPYFNKVQNVLTGLKKFDVGLCYPNYSSFLINNVPLRGINIEYEKSNKYFAFSYGTTVSTLLYDNKNIEGFLQNVRNSYNYFDFNNLSAGRKIIAANLGIGVREDNHLFVGILIGKGQTSYYNSISENFAFKSKESNVVLEVDGRYKINNKLIFDLALGKSSIRHEDLSYDVLQNSLREIFSQHRSYALNTKLTTGINRTKTNITLTFRWIDPFFRSFGVGFLRSDNIRYEVKLDQSVTKKIKYTVFFRHEEDNLLQLMNYKNTFYSINNSLTYKIRRGLTFRGSYTPLIRTLKSESFNFETRNSITTGVLTFVPHTRRAAIQFNLLYNYYLVSADSQTINFQNIVYSQLISFKGGFRIGSNVSWFKNNLSDSLNNNVLFGVLDAGYQFKNGSLITLAGKAAYKLNTDFYPGFSVKFNLKLFKLLFWENQFEKFIVGDLFNGYDLQNLKKFPYYCSTRLIFKF